MHSAIIVCFCNTLQVSPFYVNTLILKVLSWKYSYLSPSITHHRCPFSIVIFSLVINTFMSYTVANKYNSQETGSTLNALASSMRKEQRMGQFENEDNFVTSASGADLEFHPSDDADCNCWRISQRVRRLCQTGQRDNEIRVCSCIARLHCGQLSLDNDGKYRKKVIKNRRYPRCY